MVVSVDGTPDATDALKQGLLAGTVAQYPDAMAYMAIETPVKKLNGETVPEKIYSPIKLTTKDNVSDAGKYYKDELDLSSNRVMRSHDTQNRLFLTPNVRCAFPGWRMPAKLE